MELKLLPPPCPPTPHRLLIVPYGIETQFLATPDRKLLLLIVPYGIETSKAAEVG